eukprot:EC094799.1.p3 GENE.EC094799.1~~EC094799.1.p3  ORF type:complete len:122 (-),score=8.03 EC094799.1:45-410(-)
MQNKAFTLLQPNSSQIKQTLLYNSDMLCFINFHFKARQNRQKTSQKNIKGNQNPTPKNYTKNKSKTNLNGTSKFPTFLLQISARSKLKLYQQFLVQKFYTKIMQSSFSQLYNSIIVCQYIV